MKEDKPKKVKIEWEDSEIEHLPKIDIKPKKSIKRGKPKIKNFAGFKEFTYYNEKVIPEKNSGKNIPNAHFEVNSNLYKPKTLSKISLLVQYHYIMKISPAIGIIEFDGQFIMDSFKKKVGDLVKYQKKDLIRIFQNIIAKTGTKYAEKIAEKYRIEFDANTVLKRLGFK